MLRFAYKLHAGDEAGDGAGGMPKGLGDVASDGDDLPYKVEVWDAAGACVEHVVAISAHPAIGYAAFYAAAREITGRDITLSFKGRVLSRWSGKSH